MCCDEPCDSGGDLCSLLQITAGVSSVWCGSAVGQEVGVSTFASRTHSWRSHRADGCTPVSSPWAFHTTKVWQVIQSLLSVFAAWGCGCCFMVVRNNWILWVQLYGISGLWICYGPIHNFWTVLRPPRLYMGKFPYSKVSTYFATTSKDAIEAAWRARMPSKQCNNEQGCHRECDNKQGWLLEGGRALTDAFKAVWFVPSDGFKMTINKDANGDAFKVVRFMLSKQMAIKRPSNKQERPWTALKPSVFDYGFKNGLACFKAIGQLWSRPGFKSIRNRYLFCVTSCWRYCVLW